MKPSTRYSQIADAKAHGHVRAQAQRARAPVDPHPPQQDRRRQEEAGHQPPAALVERRDDADPYSGGGGSSASHGSCRTNWIGLQFTEAHMLRPMISIAMKPQISDATPVQPR